LQTGDDAWVKRYDSKTGELASQFTGEQYEPVGGGMVHVVKPKADFFSNDGKQKIRVEGATGNVQMTLPQNEKSGGGMPNKMQADAPSRGKLQDVVISVFEPLDAAEPTIVARMNNAAFDNDTFRIATEAYDDPATGKHVEADQVPVIVRGKDYDFDGRGLVIKWNERDRKLQLLQIEHGESLTIKNPSALSSPELRPATQPTAMSAMLASADPRASGVVLAAAKPSKSASAKSAKSAKNSAAAKRAAAKKRPLPTTAAATRPKIARDLSPVVYRATFERDVRIFEAGKQIIAADQMNIDLLQDSSHSDTSADAATKPAASVGAASKRPRRAATAPATASAAISSNKPTTAPASQPGQVQGPIVVKWQGKLRVVPVEGTPDPTLVGGKAKVQLVGAPVLLTREGSEGRCGTVIYNTADGNASLRGSGDVANVIMTDAQGAKVTTPQIDYVGGEGAERLANLIGPSHVEFPVEGENGVKQPATAAWTDRCVLRMIDSSTDGSGKMAIERADLFGAVKVDHPELNMTADVLSLGFDPTKSKPAPTTKIATTEPAANPSAALREVVARGNVKCRVATTQKVQTIDAQNLRLETAEGPDGKRYAKRLQADGDVRTSEDGRELRAGSLLAELAPTTRPVAATTLPTATGSDAALASASVPSTKPANPFNAGGDVKLVSLVASDHVKLTTPGPEGSTASADKLTVETRDGVETYTLYGKPDAVVTSGKTTIIGPAIRMRPDQKLAEILGAGTLKGADPNDPKQIVDIAWGRSAVMNGMADRIDVSDKVVVKSVQSDGTINTATSDRLIARLTPKLTTAPAAPSILPAKTQGSATKPSTKASDSSDPGNFLAGKEITQTTLLGNAKVKSELFNADGTLARGMFLTSEQVNYDRLTGRMDVPVAGQMLYQDHRASADTGDGPTMGSGRGKTAFGWTKSLVYDQAGQVATMSGNVRVQHQPDSGAGQELDLRGQTLRAFFEPDPAATKPTTKTATAAPTSQPMADSSKFRLKQVAMDEKVHVESPRLNFDARNMSYDPIQQVLKAAGDERSPVTVFDNESGGTTAASDLEWNTRTDQFKIRKLTGKMRK
jgi:hypothetical protein